MLVLDLDAEGDGGSGGAGETGTSSAEGGTDNQGGSGAGVSCDDGSMSFDGAQSIGVDDPSERLKLSNDVVLGAWVLPDAFAGDQYVFSRLGADKGYALMLVHSGGQLFPAVRINNGSECTCVSSVPVSTSAWSHIAGRFKKPNASVWLDGVEVCSQDCGNDDISTEQADARVGSSLGGDGGFFHGKLDDVFIRAPGGGMGPPPMVDGGGCGMGMKLLLTFDTAPSQQFAPECGDDMQATLGADAGVSSDDPTFEACP